MKAWIAALGAVLALTAAVSPAAAWVHGQKYCLVVQGQKFCSR